MGISSDNPELLLQAGEREPSPLGAAAGGRGAGPTLWWPREPGVGQAKWPWLRDGTRPRGYSGQK